jgi:hypothetical protein
MLDQLQGSDVAGENMLWGKEGEEGENRGSVIACDFYNAGALLPLSDKDIINILIGDESNSGVTENYTVMNGNSKKGQKGLLASAVPAFK